MGNQEAFVSTLKAAFAEG